MSEVAERHCAVIQKSDGPMLNWQGRDLTEASLPNLSVARRQCEVLRPSPESLVLGLRLFLRFLL